MRVWLNEMLVYVIEVINIGFFLVYDIVIRNLFLCGCIVVFIVCGGFYDEGMDVLVW